MKREMTPAERQVKAQEARQLMRSAPFIEMFDGVGEALEQKALACDPTDEKRAADIIRCKQLLIAMRREIERRSDDGDFAAFELAQLERRGLTRMFRR